MPRTAHHLNTFADIPRLAAGTRQDAWRHAMAQLASKTAERVPVPLEGMDTANIEEAVRWALSAGLCDDMTWLSPVHGAVALYELAGALRPGFERRELGRRAFERLLQGNAATFAAIARRIAVGSRHGLSGTGLAPRVDLVIDLPDGIASEAEEDGLALALLTHPHLVRKWVVDPSTGSLPSRRLCARLLERAACETLRRCTEKHRQGASLLERPGILDAWMCLLADREPLVWRHVASARGLLSQQIPMLDGEIDRDLDPTLSPTEWRRAATSAAAAIAVDPTSALARCRAILAGEVFRKDPGVAGAMVLGMSRAVRAEPDTSETLLEQLVRVGGLDTIEALVQLRRDHMRCNICDRAILEARRRLSSAEFAMNGDEGRSALVRALDRELEGPGAAATAHPSLFTYLRMAQEAYAFEGAFAAHVWAQETLAEAEVLLERMEATATETREGREESFSILRDLDYVLLERSTLAELLALGINAEASLTRLDGQIERIAKWLSSVTLTSDETNCPEGHLTFELHRMRAILHLVDSNDAVSAERSTAQKDRTLRMARWLLARVSRDVPRPLRRVLAASASRACDALLREETGELSDVLVMVGDRVRNPVDAMTMAEAAMEPTMVQVLQAYSEFLRSCQLPSPTPTSLMDALHGIVRSFPFLGTSRVEAMRSAIVAFASSLAAMHSVRSLAHVSGGSGGGSPRIPPLANAAGWLARLAAGARRRMDGSERFEVIKSECALHQIDVGVEHALRGQAGPLCTAVVDGMEILRNELPLGLASIVDYSIEQMLDLPLELRHEEPSESPWPQSEQPLVLPSWMPANRIIGGFYVLRLLGLGGTGSVFVVRRAEDRNRRFSPQFAMKIPEYGADVSHTLSETEFFDLFRAEAGAMLTIPQHPNLARFVTFDAGARPKPVLVMELVEGPTLERLIDTRVLGMRQALAVLDGIAAGLEAMHALDIGHLDLKPGNVILRMPEERVELGEMITQRATLPMCVSEATPVLVDFGLTGRRLRPGCATVEYGAPEIWGYVPRNKDSSPAPTPMRADVYAFACLAFETLTGDTLFHGSTSTAVIASHVAHDGYPSAFAKLKKDPVGTKLAKVLRRGLRRNAQDRCTITDLRAGLAELEIDDRSWPLR